MLTLSQQAWLLRAAAWVLSACSPLQTDSAADEAKVVT